MPRLTNSVPKYCKHRASGQAVVTIGARDIYLGPYGTKASRVAYDRVIGEWLTNDRRAPTSDVAVVELVAAFWAHAKKHYVKNGRPTCEQAGMKIVCRYLREMYGDVDVSDFTPLSLETIRNQMVEAGNSRGYINQNVGRIKHIFKWGTAKCLVPESVYRAVATVEGLQAGKCDARETEPVQTIAGEVVDATLPHMPSVVADMVRFQQLTGCRPEEVCLVRRCDIERAAAVWRYVPQRHKMEHKSQKRVIMIGPRCQEVLSPYLLREIDSYCFINPECGREYTSRTYRDAIHRACEVAFGCPGELREMRNPPKGESTANREKRSARARAWRKAHCWNPNRLRHNTATALRKAFGVEASQVVLGHTKLNTTEIYAERDLEKAAEIMAQVG